MTLKNLAATVALIVFFVGFTALVRSRYYDWMLDVQTQLAARPDIVELTVKHSSCTYLLPRGAFQTAAGLLMCPQCLDLADHITADYTVELLDDACGGRGTAQMKFTKKTSASTQAKDQK